MIILISWPLCIHALPIPRMQRLGCVPTPNPNCRTENPPVPNVFINVYRTQCMNPNCQKLIKVAQDFKLTDFILNEIDIDFPAYHQHNTEIVRRMKAAVLYKASDTLPLYPKSLTTSHMRQVGTPIGGEPGDGYSRRIVNVILCAQIDGVSFLRGIGSYDDEETSDFPPIKIYDKFLVPSDDVFLLKRLIASGFPLVACIISGNCLLELGAGEVYTPPKSGYPYPHPVMGHAVLLQGSGTDEVGIYFTFRDSCGPNCHKRWFDLHGADARLRPGDFDGCVYGFVLENWLC